MLPKRDLSVSNFPFVRSTKNIQVTPLYFLHPPPPSSCFNVNNRLKIFTDFSQTLPHFMDHLIKRDEILYKILFNLVNKKHWGFRRKYIQFLIYNIEKITGYICNELCNHASNF